MDGAARRRDRQHDRWTYGTACRISLIREPARAAMHNLAQTAACEWVASGVRVNSIAPRLIASSGFDNYSSEAVTSILGFPGKNPAQRFGTVAEVSPAASCIAGSCIGVDGGSSLAGPAFAAEHDDKSIPYQGFQLESLPAMLREGGNGSR